MVTLVLRDFSILRGWMTHNQNIFSIPMKVNFFPNILIPIWVLKKVYKVWFACVQNIFNFCVGVALRGCLNGCPTFPLRHSSIIQLSNKLLHDKIEPCGTAQQLGTKSRRESLNQREASSWIIRHKWTPSLKFLSNGTEWDHANKTFSRKLCLIIIEICLIHMISEHIKISLTNLVSYFMVPRSYGL